MLVLGPVTRIGVHDQLSVRHVLRQDESVDRRNDNVFCFRELSASDV